MSYSPLEQFEIVPYLNIGSWGQFSFTNSAFYLVVTMATVYAMFNYATQTASVVPTRWQALTEMVYSLVHNMIMETAGPKGERYYPLILTVFLFVAGCNLQGLVPYTFTVTSQLIVTLAFALALFIGINIIAFQTHGLHFFSFFLPAGIPIGMAPLLILIETISYVFRVVSLSARLFANMFAGHALLKILATFAWQGLKMGGLAIVGTLPLLLVIFGISGLEIAIAFLQGYVFASLTCMYLADAIHLH